MKTVLPAVFRRDEDRTDLIRIGSEYGGWWVPSTLLTKDSVCYCGGVGTDISFDLGLIDTFGCKVWGIDPTPKTINWLQAQPDLHSLFTFVPVGLGGTEGEMRFYAPSDPEHVSHSVKNLQSTNTYFEARVQTIAGLMAEQGHERVDLLKLDIEGAEHDTIRQMLDDNIYPSILCVEYDQPEPLRWQLETTRRLRAAGYKLAKLETLNLTFVRRSV